MKFNEYKQLDLVSTGNDVLEKWKAGKAFEHSLALREGEKEFVFFEGPPSANGMPGIHHVMARSIKDSICRYKTMTGHKVSRRAGWDTHGLPVELGVEKLLGITKEDIGKKISVEDYNAACRREVMKYTREWVNLTERIGYWVDMDDPYITYDNRYVETLWYLLKDIYGKGYLYKGKSVQPYSPAAGTGLSSHELNQPGCYRDVKDTTVTVQFDLIRDEASEFLFQAAASAEGASGKVCVLAWTTTPWTLPSNTALCVGPNIDYVLIQSANPYTGEPCTYLAAKALVPSLFNGKVPFTVLEGSYKGSQLVGMHYRQLIPWFRPDDGAFRVIPGDYVTTEDGTGIVHIAPTFGADDAKVAKAAGVPPMLVKDANGDPQAQVDLQGRFYRLEDLDPDYVKERVDPSYQEWAGRYVKNAYDSSLAPDAPTLDIDLCVWMKGLGKAFKIEKHTHTYPHCWRTDKPVLYYPLDSWFIKATAVREQMMALNEGINWKPESTGTGRFGKWLENIQDWNLSRSRYWGTPLPIWRTEDGKEEKCIGTLKELYAEIDKAVAAGVMASNPFKDAGFDPEDMSKANYDKIDLHRPYVDRIFLVSDSGRKMVRESDLIDVWFDSGAMPYAQEGLRGIHSEKFGCTADFIAEGVDQTRGWFYTLHAIHTMVSGTPAFKTVISNGLVLDKDGNKMSKRLGNAVDPFKALDEYGADALRWYMLTNAQPWDNLKFDEAGVAEVRRKFFGTLYNTYALFAVYANIDNFDPSAPAIPVAQRPEFDRWIISNLHSLIKKVEACYEDYNVTDAGRMIQDFVCDDLSNWYIRLNKKRIWTSGASDDKLSAYQTIWEVLKTVALLAAPIAPFFTDRLWCDLVPSAENVHYELMPACDESLIDTALEERMALAQKTCSMVLALRKKVGINVKKPLPRLMVPVLSERLQAQLDAVRPVILAEVNVKELEFIADTTGIITKKIKPNFKTLGKIYGPRMKEIAAAFGTMPQEQIAAIEKAEGDYMISLPGGDVVLSKSDYEIHSEDMPGWLVASEGALTVALDITLTPELIEEGTARELIRPIQNLRKEKDFAVTDRIRTAVYADGEVYDDIAASLRNYRDYVMSQTLSTALTLGKCAEAPADAAEVEWGDTHILIQVVKTTAS
ncbi:MAG: isoleucine--tRNA ligase [Bacteroidales bacterium]|nr:isoleucine--tRNA ligase [Bacteroidales bacterium]